MKFVAVAVFVFFFVALPMYLLNSLVMPELNTLHHTYSSFGQTAQNIAEAN